MTRRLGNYKALLQTLIPTLRPRLALAGFGILLLTRVDASMAAQQPDAGTVRVVVIDERWLSVIGAEVTMSSDKRNAASARTDSSGAVVLRDMATGLWRVEVRRIGLKPVATTIRVAAGENAYTIRVQDAALTLTGMRIVGGRSYVARLDDFERRRLSGVPSAVVTREEIDRIGPISLSRMLRGMSGIRIGDSLGNVVAISTRGAKPMRLPDRPGITMVQCVLRVVVDGVIQPALSSVDQIVPNDVHGIEVYFGPARLPPELAGIRTDNWCGVVAIWTRDR
jgi:hypothetical protein